MTLRWTYIAFGFLLTTGCGRRTDVVQVTPTTQDVIVKDKGVEIKTSGTGNLKLPAGFPADVPQYPGAKIETVASDQEKTFTIAMSTPDPASKVFAFYEKKLNENGWKELFKAAQGDGGSIAAKKEELNCSVFLSGADQKTQIVMNVATEKK